MAEALPPSEYLSVADAAALLGVHPNTVRRAIRAGQLTAHTPLGRPPDKLGALGYRIARAEVLRWYRGEPREATSAG